MYHILSVDDQPANQKLIEHALAKQFKVQTVGNGKDALQAIAENRPDLILLDVYMPVMDGLETCRRVREVADAEELPVIFVSALCSLNDKLNGYEAGGNDYIPKPFHIAELISKIKALLDHKNRAAKSEKSKNSIRRPTSSVTNGSVGLAGLLHFFEQSSQSETPEDLAKAVFKANAQLGLSTSLQLRIDGEEFNFASRGLITPAEAELSMTPLETELLSQARHSKQIINYGNKSLYNSDTVTILVKNMPFEDSKSCERIREHLAIILRACEVQLALLVTKEKLHDSRNHQIDLLGRKMPKDFGSLYDKLDRLFERCKDARSQKEAVVDLIFDITTDLSAIKES